MTPSKVTGGWMVSKAWREGLYRKDIIWDAAAGARPGPPASPDMSFKSVRKNDPCAAPGVWIPGRGNAPAVCRLSGCAVIDRLPSCEPPFFSWGFGDATLMLVVPPRPPPGLCGAGWPPGPIRVCCLACSSLIYRLCSIIRFSVSMSRFW